MLYSALGPHEWQLCSTLQRFTSCASAVSTITEQHIPLYELRKEKRVFIFRKPHPVFFHPGNTAVEMGVKTSNELNMRGYQLQRKLMGQYYALTKIIIIKKYMC